MGHIVHDNRCSPGIPLLLYFPNDLQRRMEQVIQQKVKEGLIRPKVGVQLLDQYSKAFHEYTYLDSNDGA